MTYQLTPAEWAAYDAVTPGDVFDIVKPLSGWRFDRVFEDGGISDYDDDGTRLATCKVRTLGFNRWMAPIPRAAPGHDPLCTCGYRIVRDLDTLLAFGQVQGTRMRHALSTGESNGAEFRGMVLSRVLGTGEAAYGAITEPVDPPGTIRVEHTRLVEVYMPTEFEGGALSNRLAQRVRDRYGVKVSRIQGDLFIAGREKLGLPAWTHAA